VPLPPSVLAAALVSAFAACLVAAVDFEAFALDLCAPDEVFAPEFEVVEVGAVAEPVLADPPVFTTVTFGAAALTVFVLSLLAALPMRKPTSSASNSVPTPAMRVVA